MTCLCTDMKQYSSRVNGTVNEVGTLPIDVADHAIIWSSWPPLKGLIVFLDLERQLLQSRKISTVLPQSKENYSNLFYIADYLQGLVKQALSLKIFLKELQLLFLLLEDILTLQHQFIIN